MNSSVPLMSVISNMVNENVVYICTDTIDFPWHLYGTFDICSGLHFAPMLILQLHVQEVETEQYYTFFLETLKERGYDGFFCPKSRAKLVSEQERKHVDGCAVFFKTEKWVSPSIHYKA